MRTDLKLITSSLLVLSIFSATARGDATTDAGTGAATLISGAALGLGQVASGVNQANTLAGNVAASARMGAVGNQLSQTNLALAQAIATEQQCEQKAKSGKRSASGTALPLNAILAEKPNCSTYDKVWGDALTWLDQFAAANDRFLCIKNMQTAMDSLATGQFKQQLKAFIDAANAAYDSQQAIVTNYEDMGKKIKGDLEGDNGFVSQLDQLHGAINQLQSIIGGAASGGPSANSAISMGGESFAGNLNQQVKDLKIANNQVANGWMKKIISDAVNNCFVSNGNIPCRLNSTGGQVNMSPLACIQSATNQTVGQNSTQGILNSGNANNINSLIQQQQDILQKSITSTSLDPSNIGGFTDYVKTQFGNALSSMSSQFNGIALNGSGTSVAQLQSFYQGAMNQCFNQALNNFQQDISSQGPNYYAAYSQLDTQKSAILSTENQATTTITNLMNKFVTNFSQNYSSGLAQFSANCSATTDPNAGLDCLKELKAQLESGINGNTSFAQLSTGGSYTASPSPTTITLQHLTLDQQGNPVSAPDQQSCVGFNACITLMKQRQTYDEGQAITYKQKLVGFAKQANAQIDTVVGAAGTTFNMASDKMAQVVAGLSSSLAALGVPATAGITMKKADPASISKDKDKNNLYTSEPMADMKGLLGVSDMDPDSVTANATATTEMKNKVKDLANTAANLEAGCKVVRSDFAALEKKLGSCNTPANFCRASKPIEASLSGIMKRGQVMGSKTETDSSDDSTLSSCDCGSPSAACDSLPQDIKPGATASQYSTCQASNAEIQRCKLDCKADDQALVLNKYTARNDKIKVVTNDISDKLLDMEGACSLLKADAMPKDCSGETLPDICRYCNSLSNAIDGGVNPGTDEIPDKMPEPETVADKGINSSDGFTNPLKDDAKPAKSAQ